MIKSEKGITLMVLTVTIIVLLILAGVGLNTGLTSLNDVKSNQLNAELSMVRQAIVERYAEAVAVNQTEKLPSEALVSFWMGERIENFSEIQLPEKSSVKENEDVNDFYGKTTQYVCKYQEDYYYRLTPENLKQMGIADAEHTYIVNYKTGEVYNETKKVDGNSELLYLPAMTSNKTGYSGDQESFNDWQ